MKWCDWHSDWSLALCVFEFAGVEPVSLQEPRFRGGGFLFDQTSSYPHKHRCSRIHATYHPAKTSDCIISLDSRYVDGGVRGVGKYVERAIAVSGAKGLC
jgi:hypothetical protein